MKPAKSDLTTKSLEGLESGTESAFTTSIHLRKPRDQRSTKETKNKLIKKETKEEEKSKKNKEDASSGLPREQENIVEQRLLDPFQPA
jgi:hypothetical protein